MLLCLCVCVCVCASDVLKNCTVLFAQRIHMGHFMSSQTTYAPHVPNLAQFFHIYWSSYEFSFPNFVCS